MIPLVVSLLEIIRHNMFAAVTFATVSMGYSSHITSVVCANIFLCKTHELMCVRAAV